MNELIERLAREAGPLLMKGMTQDEIRHLFNYDPLDGVVRWAHDKYLAGRMLKAGSPAGCVNTHGYIQIQTKKTMHYAHRIAWFYVHGNLPEMVDHIDGDRKNNKLANLRGVTRMMNNQNITKAGRGNRSGFLGVHHNPGSLRYRSRIVVEGKNLELGYFETAQAAHAAYVAAKIRLHAGAIPSRFSNAEAAAKAD